MKFYSGTEISNTSLINLSYKQPENQLTHALLQLFQAGGVDFFYAFCRHCGVELPHPISILSQVTHADKGKKDNSIPDGMVQLNPIRIFIENKLKINAIDEKQLRNHLQYLPKSVDETREPVFLLYITPDEKCPAVLEAHSNNNVLWNNWNSILKFIDEYADIHPYVRHIADVIKDLWDETPKSTWLTIPQEERAVVLGGRHALPVAIKDSIYYCQKGRKFNDSKYMAFYCDHKITHVYEIISGPHNNYNNTTDDWYEIKLFKDDLLIINDKEDKNRNETPYTMGSPRYVSLTDLLSVKKTSELEKPVNQKITNKP